MATSRDPEDYEWKVLPGREVAHAIVGTAKEGRGICGHTRGYEDKRLTPAGKDRRRCEQCQITILSGVNSMVYKFFVDHVPHEVRQTRRRAWRAYLGRAAER